MVPLLACPALPSLLPQFNRCPKVSSCLRVGAAQQAGFSLCWFCCLHGACCLRPCTFEQPGLERFDVSAWGVIAAQLACYDVVWVS